jgi:hypothetical protein
MECAVMTDKEKNQAGKVCFSSSDSLLNEGFRWAKEQALAYAHFGEDPVGLWYEAALPERDAFCMRDVAHQTAGAAVLGLHHHSKNMLFKFAENISETRDWCSYWEINKENRPAPVDYTDDRDFWYNLPANFDVIDACYRQFLWTGDRTYLNDPTFESFYKHSVSDYVKTWDKDGDGILEHLQEYGRRGIASYNEVGIHPKIGGDMIGAQFAGYQAFAKIAALNGDMNLSNEYESKAKNLRDYYQNVWWNDKEARFYGALLHNNEFYEKYYMEGNFLPLYFGIVQDKNKLRLALEDLIKNGVPNVEAKTYLPDIYYKYGWIEKAYHELLELVDPSLHRREYPEVSFTVIGAIAVGMMGISADGHSEISTNSRLVDATEWAKILDVPVLGHDISVEHIGRKETRLTNICGGTLHWKASFSSDQDYLIHNHDRIKAMKEWGEDGEIHSYIVVEVGEGETHSVKLPD